MTEGDMKWIGRSLYTAKGKLTTQLKLWWHPPPYQAPIGKPSPQFYHQRRLFLWMPRRMWEFNFMCPHCSTPRPLRSKGMYTNIRTVLDLRDFYYLAAEYMDCNHCSGTFVAWDDRILNQLPCSLRAHFPAVLTRKYACDQAVVTLFRARTLGNSPTALRNNLMEVHSEEWLRKQLVYLGDCAHHRYIVCLNNNYASKCATLFAGKVLQLPHTMKR